ncbi:uncharacterized protein LOC119435352 isoform X1 [Dermacentor silvarum]|uniref:uncharacterized protein LOC119435352 isoform X1 n=1 Tax=Dermacentor silvarum TaxID=543639 RepID=UPI00189BA5C6|nr:uncharacterized protein LOC119435352 isoform X1 [Dermacentor silvarum]
MSNSGNSAAVPPLKSEEVKPGAQDALKSCKDQAAKAPQGAEAKGTPEAAKTAQPDAAAVNVAKTEGAQPRPVQNVEGDAKVVCSVAVTLSPSFAGTDQKDQQKSKGPEVHEISLEDIDPDATVSCDSVPVGNDWWF